MTKSVFTDAYAIMREALVAARKDAGVSQVDLAQRLGRTQSFVSQIERGVRRIDVIEFYVVAKAIGTDPVILFTSLAEKLPARIDIS